MALRRNRLALSLGAVLLIILESAIPAFAASTVGTSTVTTATEINGNSRACFASGRYWVFWFDGTNYAFSSSTDGVTWKTKTTITTSGTKAVAYNGWWCQGSTLYYVVGDNSGAKKAYYDSGTMNLDGTVTFGAEQSLTTKNGGTNVFFPSIAPDTLGNIWIGVTTRNGSLAYSYEIWECGGGSCSFSTKAATASNFQENTYMIPLTAGKMAFIHGPDQGPDKVRGWAGASWSADVSESATGIGYDGGASAIGDTVEACGYVTGAKITYISWVYGAGSWVGSTLLGTQASDTSCAISTDGTSLITVFYTAASNNHVYYVQSSNSGGSFGSEQTLESSENTPLWITAAFQYSANGPAGVAPVSWTQSGGVSPFNVRFDAVQVCTNCEGTVTVTIACTYTQLQCWWYPSLFMLLFSGFFLVVAGASRASPKTAMHLFLSGLTYGSFVAVIFGIMNITFPLVLLLVNTFFILRMRGR